MNARGKVSVIIPNYNYANYVGQAIESVLSQTYRNIEVIVVNNGSTDNSLEVLEKYREKIVLVDQENLGQSGSRKSGLSRATGEYISFLDADDFWEPEKIERQIALFSNKTELVYCGISRYDEVNQKISSIDIPSYRGDCSYAFIDFPAVSIVLSGESTSIFTRSLFEQVGGFDPELNSSAGWDFFRRCSKFTEFDFVPEPLTNYRLHSSNMSNSSANSISDIRRAYGKMFADELWILPRWKVHRTIFALEYSFFKTYLKKGEWVAALKTGMGIFFSKKY